MKYKLIATDIDGTLLKDDKTLSARTLAAINRVREAGGIFAVSSGRTVHFCNFFEKVSGLKNLPFILYNGARVVDGPGHSVLFSQGLDRDTALWLINEGNRLKTTVIVWANDVLHVNEINERIEFYIKLALIDPVLITDPEEIVKNGADKILWFDEAERTPYLHSVLDASPIASKINHFTSDPRFMEIVDVNCSKALALEKLCRHYGIKREECIAVGDGFNDLPMIEWAGLGVAMANADDAIKQKADAVTLSNEEDGVAALIEKYF